MNTDKKIRDDFYREYLELKRLLAERNKQVALMEIEMVDLRQQLDACMAIHEAEHCNPGGGPFIESRPDLQRRLAQ